jgi:Tol biopolymer transport system component
MKIDDSRNRVTVYDAFTVEPSGANLTRVTEGLGDGPSADWSRDGRLAWAAYQQGGITVDGTRAAFGDDYDATPSWSPDGRIAFAKVTGGIYIGRPESPSVRFLTPGELPRWSPDGSVIAFADYPGAPMLWHTIRPDGSGLQDLGVFWGLDWSSAGKLAVARGDGCSVQIEVDGTPLTPPGEVNRHPVWSPDGKQIAYEHVTTDTFLGRCLLTGSATYLMRSDGSEAHLLVAPQRLSDTQEATSVWPSSWEAVPFKNASKRCKAFPQGRNHGRCVKARRG